MFTVIAHAEFKEVTRPARIISEPMGAKVKINGKVLGLTPLYNVMIPVGKVRIQIEMEGDERYSTIDIKESIEESRETYLIDKELPERMAYIRLNIKPKEAEVILNSILIDPDKRDRIAVPISKEHYLLINAPMHDREQLQIPPLAPDQVYSVDVKLKPKPCQLYITSNPSFAEVRLNGKILGSTPLDYSVSPGEHVLEIEKDQYDSQETSFSCERGQHIDRAIFLVRSIYTNEEKAILSSSNFWKKASTWTFAGSMLLGATAYWKYSEFQKLDDEYVAATNPVEIENLRQKREEAKAFSSSSAIGAGVGLGLSILFYKWGIIPEELRSRQSIGIQTTPHGGMLLITHKW